jgi:uncharacterized membrane protein YqiK
MSLPVTKIKANSSSSVSQYRRDQSSAIGVMCIVIIVASILYAVYDWWARREIRKQARNIVIASAAFDKTGKLLVKNDGTLPMQVIQTDADLQVGDPEIG